MSLLSFLPHLWRTLDMTNDAKLGLVVGVCLVIGVAVAFFRRPGARADE